MENANESNRHSRLLKLALLATGLSGIVAEYILATLATYFLGDSVLQWTMVLSVMLFSMGLGSRLSKYVHGNLLKKFIYTEFALSVLTSFSAVAVYVLAAYTIYEGFFIYLLSTAIGILIGLEIPLVTRLNSQFEELHVNISEVMEKDYYGSLIGGVFFAFIGLPYLGITYTPFVLGAINFLVALALFIKVGAHIEQKGRRVLSVLAVGILVILTSGVFLVEPIITYGEQARYKDKIVYQEQTRYQKIVVTKWKNHHWLFINGNQQLATIDEHMYHEPLCHPAMQLAAGHKRVLIMGGGDGCAVREVLKYNDVESVKLIDLDPAMTRLGLEHPVFVGLNDSALHRKQVTIINEDGFNWLEDNDETFDVVIIDLPDPKTVDLGRLYSLEFYGMIIRRMQPGGIVITQATSPYYSTLAFNCIEKTMRSAGLNTLPLHNQVMTLGEWGWVMGSPQLSRKEMKSRLTNDFDESIPTQWFNRDAAEMTASFGKPMVDTTGIETNTLLNPVLYRYYLQGNWDLY
ncbi:MAG: polyamine aminopropyltransferase [Cyclobacteriaceae bacterium]